MTDAIEESPPIACTLGVGDLASRLAAIAKLNLRALRSHRRDGLRLELAYAPEARDAIVEIVRLEQSCCAFLKFEVREGADAVRVIIEAPETARQAAETVFAPFVSKPRSRTACGCGAMS
jgi:hypothetical protein